MKRRRGVRPRPPLGMVALAPTCRVQRQSDELYCSTCTLRWEASDERPTCPLTMKG